MSGPYLEVELAAAQGRVSFAHLRALERLGVPRSLICDLSRHGHIGVVLATSSGDGLYQPGEGAPQLVIPVYDEGALVDLCAFRSNDPNGWLLRTGLGWALGVEHGLEPHTWGDPVPLALSPLEWLQQGASGLCVLDWDAPEVRYLVGVPHLVCSDADHAATLRRALSTPVRLPQISVMETRLAA
jgi:hypothetical protein